MHPCKDKGCSGTKGKMRCSREEGCTMAKRRDTVCITVAKGGRRGYRGQSVADSLRFTVETGVPQLSVLCCSSWYILLYLM